MTNRAWGVNSTRGVLGLGLSNSTIYRTPQAMAGSVVFTQIDAAHATGTNQRTAIGLSAAGEVYTWGDNSEGQLGIGSTDTSVHSTPTLLASLSGIVKIGSYAEVGVFALDNAGNLYGWGRNNRGQLAQGDTTTRTAPVLISTGVVDFSAGSEHTVILKTGGVVQSAGSNSSGQLGTTTNSGTFNPNTSLITVTPGSGTVVGVACLQQSTYLLMADGTVQACGRGDMGQLGYVPTPSNTQPNPAFTAVPSLANVVLIGRSANSGYFKLSDATVWALGNNFNGALGVGQTFAALPKTYSPVQMVWPSGVTVLAFGQGVASYDVGGTLAMLALGSDHLAYTWATGTNGQMGDGGSTAANNTPISVNGLVYVNVVGGGDQILYADALDVAPARGRSWAAVIG